MSAPVIAGRKCPESLLTRLNDTKDGFVNIGKVYTYLGFQCWEAEEKRLTVSKMFNL